MLTFSFVFTDNINAEEHFSTELSKKDEHSFESRVATKEPDYLFSGTISELQGFYFGVGFRNVRIRVADNVIISDSDGEANGIGVNIGYFWEEQSVEYERQISIVEHSKSFIYESKSGQKVEVIQNNLWYVLYPKISLNFYLHYGAGIQFTKSRFAATGNRMSFEDEIAMGVEAGASYFVMSNLIFYYRFSISRHIPFLKISDSSTFLKQSQLHTIFMNYYFSL